jgi:polysaccharide chain length determinant protein (PEP-CTERM system associated)
MSKPYFTEDFKMIPKEGLNLKYFIAVLRRRFWYVVLPFFILSLASVVYCIKAPKIYKSSTLILIQPQEVPTDYVRPLVTSDARSRLNILSEQVMSRPRLEELIKKYDLYPEVRQSSTMYDAVQIMRKQISVGVRSKGRGNEPASFEVTYVGDNPAKVKEVTTAIANLFIDYNLKLREDQTAGTTKFLERELDRVREQLRQKEEIVRRFKTKYLGMLPEHMENNYRILDQLQQQLASVNDTLQQIEDRKVLLRSQLGRSTTLDPDIQAPLNLDQLRQKLQSLRVRYTEQHPDVIRLATMISRIEKEQEKNGVQMSPSPIIQGQPSLTEESGILTQLKLLEQDSQELQGEKVEISRQIEEYRGRIENGPKLEQMYVDLRRDYQQVDENYQSLLKRKLQAKMAENLERTQKGEQFRILEPANLPETPFKPNIQSVLSMGLMLGLACGFGLAFLREYLNQTICDRKELENFLQLPVLVSIPVIPTRKQRSWNMLKKAATACVLACMTSVLFYALLVLWGKNLSFPL